MLDWERVILYFYITMRMTGFIVFNPIFGRTGIPALAKAGFSMVLAFAAASFTTGGAPVPPTMIEFAFRLLMELALGYLLGYVVQLFFYIPVLAGEAADSQMGFAMAKTYDPAMQTNMAVTGNVLTILATLVFFAANGHNTMLRIILSSGQIVPYGEVAFGSDVAAAVLDLFISCTVLGIKLIMPILAAELMGQAAMGILMKAIPQIHVFSINIDMKVLIGLVLLLVLISPFSDFLLEAESQMLVAMQDILHLVH